MRCREARLRLTVFSETGQDLADDVALLEHLKKCPACARQAQAAREIGQAFAEASIHDTTDRIDWSEQARRVESQAALTQHDQPKEIPFMSAIQRQFKMRPRLGLGLVAAACVLLAATLIPLKFDETVGFEVAVAGVNRDLALNQEKLDEMLERLGLTDVHIDVTGCEVTCNLVVSDLESAKDAHMIRLAFEEIGEDQIYVNLTPVQEYTTQSALGHAVHNIWISEDAEFVDDTNLHHIVIERLGTDFTGENVFFFTDEGGESVTIKNIDLADGDHGLVWTSEGNDVDFHKQMGVVIDETPDLQPHHWDGDKLTDEAIEEFRELGWEITVSDDATTVTFSRVDDGSASTLDYMYYTTDSPDKLCAALIRPENIVDGRLTDDARRSLEAIGYKIEESAGEDGMLTIRLSKESGDDVDVMEFTVDAEADDSVNKSGALPEGYALSQNYPNPFNPITNIDYSLPRSEYVTIEVYNINGQKVRTLIDEVMPPGNHTVEWDATSDNGDRVASGVYLYRFAAGDMVETRKMTLVK